MVFNSVYMCASKSSVDLPCGLILTFDFFMSIPVVLLVEVKHGSARFVCWHRTDIILIGLP